VYGKDVFVKKVYGKALDAKAFKKLAEGRLRLPGGATLPEGWFTEGNTECCLPCPVAERVGFEPTIPETGITDFKSVAIDHSATSP
jgi:hypothetical protein